MYTQCPECQSVFAIDAATLAQAHGCVGCGQCGATFDTMATLTDAFPRQPFGLFELNHPSAEPPILLQRLDAETAREPEPGEAVGVAPDTEDVTDDGGEPAVETEATDDLASADTPGAETIDLPAERDDAWDDDHAAEVYAAWEERQPGDDEAPLEAGSEPEEALAEEARSTLERELAELDAAERTPESEPTLSPAFRRRQRTDQRFKRRMVAACTVLGGLLALQLAWAERAALARNPSTGALVRSICGALGCMPMVKDLERIELVSRDVRKHPSVEDALIISATMRNQAPFTQPYPVLVITLSDLDDHRVAMRRFRPTEYLHDAEVRDAGLAPGARAALVFEVHDPGGNAVAFEFAFE